ncbi:MAG: hypothetical protein IJ991_07870 [Thermoguttaceae bacterium]|nr:hypothetical protein [Thermoguttaceae bacterium]
MSIRYQLTCPRCQRPTPIETSQAGQSLSCECGELLRVPTMLKIKRLPLWGDDGTAVAAPPTEAPADDVQNASTPDADAAFAASSSKRPDLFVVADAAPAASSAAPANPAASSGKRWGLFAVAALVTVVGAFFFCANLRTPDPRAVFYKRVVYASGDGKTVRRDSSPIDALDYSFYFLQDPLNDRVYLVDDYLLDNMSFFHAYHYLDAVKKPELSDNFYENYEAIKSRVVIYRVMAGVATLLGFALALFALLAPEKRRNVGAARGDAWR